MFKHAGIACLALYCHWKLRHCTACCYRIILPIMRARGLHQGRTPPPPKQGQAYASLPISQVSDTMMRGTKGKPHEVFELDSMFQEW